MPGFVSFYRKNGGRTIANSNAKSLVVYVEAKKNVSRYFIIAISLFVLFVTIYEHTSKPKNTLNIWCNMTVPVK